MSWTTKNEIKFLRHIGTHDKKRPRNPKKCLEGYLKGAELRDDWGRIDKKEAIRTAKALLRTMI